MAFNHHITESDIRLFNSGNLPAHEIVEVAEHMESCTQCRSLLNRISVSIERSPVTINLSPETYFLEDHIDYEVMADYLDGILDDEERDYLEGHLNHCMVCSTRVRNLKEFRETSDIEFNTSHKSGNFNFKKMLAGINFTGRPGFAFGLIAALMLILIVISFYYFNSSKVPTIVERGPDQKPGPQEPLNAEKRDSQPDRPDPDPLVHDSRRETRRTEFSVALIDGGRRVGLDLENRLTGFESVPPEIKKDIRDVLQGKELSTGTEIEELASYEVMARSGVTDEKTVNILSPVGTLIRDDKPVLKWRKLEGATAYVVNIVDERFNIVSNSPRITSTEWVPEKSLERGRIYQWQVIAYKDDTLQESRLNQVGLFKIITPDKLNQVQRVEKNLKSNLALAIFYAREGLMDEARQQIQKLSSGGNEPGTIEKISKAILKKR